MGCVRPAHVVEVGIPLRVCLGCSDKPASVVLVHRRLHREQEPRSHPRPVGAEREHGRDATPVADPARGENRDGCDSVDDSRHKREGGDVAPNVAARLPTLGDDDVNTGSYRPFPLLGAADRMENEPVRGVYAFNVRPRVAPRERDDPQPRLERASSRAC